MRCAAAGSVSIRPPHAALLALAATAALSLPRAAGAAPDLATQRDPVTLRVALDAQQLKAARLHVPAGTRAYRVGDPASARGAMVAWYRAGDGRLLAAIHLSPRDAHPPTTDGVRVHAGAGHQGRAAALFEVATTRDMPSLADAAHFAVQPHGGAEQAVAPLLSYRGSTHVVALAPAMDQAQLRAPRFDVRTRDANGALENELRALNAAGGTPPVLVSGAATRPGVPSELFALNPGQNARLIEVEPKPPLRWSAPPAQVLPVMLPPGTKTPIGAVVSDVPGAFNLVYRDQPVQDSAGGQLAAGPLVSDRAGNSGVQVTSSAPIEAVQVVQGNGPAGVNATVSNLPLVSGGSAALNRIAIAGGAAGVIAVMLVDREGRRQASEVAIVPLEEDMLQRQREWVTIETVQSGGETWMQDGKKCKCEKVTVKPVIGKDGPEVKVDDTSVDGNELTLTITANWVATITCTPGDGKCSDTLTLDKSSSGWVLDGRRESNAEPVEGSETFIDSASPPKQPKTKIECAGPCGKETVLDAFSTTYTVKLKKDGGGNIGPNGKFAGKVTLEVKPGPCGGSGWKMELKLVRKEAKGREIELEIDWPDSDRDGDGKTDRTDKEDDPKPKPRDDAEDKPKADPNAGPKK